MARARCRHRSGVLLVTSRILQHTVRKYPGTNPEELDKAAHAGCFSMALSGQLGAANRRHPASKPRPLFTMEKLESGWTITAVHLDVTGRVPNADQAAFQKAAENAKSGCPVSKVLVLDTDDGGWKRRSLRTLGLPCVRRQSPKPVLLPDSQLCPCRIHCGSLLKEARKGCPVTESLLPSWRNWQTRMVQVHVLARVWGFESLRWHQDFSCIFQFRHYSVPSRSLTRFVLAFDELVTKGLLPFLTMVTSCQHQPDRRLPQPVEELTPKPETDLRQLERHSRGASSTGFRRALESASQSGIAVIAESKRRLRRCAVFIRPDFDAESLAREPKARSCLVGLN